MDYTEIFSKAIELKSHYNFDEIKKCINAHNDFHCGDYDDWADNAWYLLTPTWVVSYDKCYGYLCAEYPIALLSDYCPGKLKRLLVENGVICTQLDEPMSCDESILQQYVHDMKVFDENFVEKCEYSFDDERFLKLLYKLETGHKQYIDSGSFTMKEIR